MPESARIARRIVRYREMRFACQYCVQPLLPGHSAAIDGPAALFLTPFEWTIAKRYMLPGRSEAFIALVAGISLVAVMLGVAALVIVMSVMNGFRAELFDKIVGLNGHAIIQAYGGRLRSVDGDSVLAVDDCCEDH